MSNASVFRFKQATFDFGNGHPVGVDLVADQSVKAKNTHFTLLMGANGTCKSRILSCCVNLLKGIHERANTELPRKERRLFRTDEPDRDMQCSSATLLRDGATCTVGEGPLFESGALLPSRVLAIANLVRDRFTFVDWDNFEDPFYYYLGVRQSSNLTTTGAMDRLVCDAVLKLLANESKYPSFSKWTRSIFPSSDIGLSFSRFSMRRFHDFFDDPEKSIGLQLGRGRRGEVPHRLNAIKPHLDDMRRVVRLIEENALALGDSGSLGMKQGGTVTICLDELTPTVRQRLGKLSQAISIAASIRLIGRPSLVLNVGKWLDFTQLSSGEQNLLSTGARLLAFGAPGSLIVIDEPEVSLNIAWQQRYIDLISDALVHAKGSHVIIASHSPYLVSDLRAENSTVVVVERGAEGLKFRSHPGEFWGWGSEAILYEVLGLPSASNYHFSRELAGVLKLVSEKSTDAEPFAKFLSKCDQLDFGPEAEPLKAVIGDIRKYAGRLKS
ncbi:AAA family ATPase [Prosthecobacter sp.]|uniref:AAA family ATPase n=1 Tax=Prosthecobacter sp. TaxID=1965333 RepID=UPI002ABCAEB8|nr:AAA family ATPase [Prosthecobacter sp.]MDZ4402349.1 AAA family ATPase [Prosthecobacter sp.]